MKLTPEQEKQIKMHILDEMLNHADAMTSNKLKAGLPSDEEDEAPSGVVIEISPSDEEDAPEMSDEEKKKILAAMLAKK